MGRKKKYDSPSIVKSFRIPSAEEEAITKAFMEFLEQFKVDDKENKENKENNKENE